MSNVETILESIEKLTLLEAAELNSYMRNGTGYYRYSSFEDFKNGAAPESFALAYGYNGNTKPSAEDVYKRQGSDSRCAQ